MMKDYQTLFSYKLELEIWKIGRQNTTCCSEDKHVTKSHAQELSLYFTCNLVFTTSKGQVIVAPTVPPTLRKTKIKLLSDIWHTLLSGLKLQPKNFSIPSAFLFGLQISVF